MTLTNTDCSLTETDGGGGADFFTKQFEDENAGIIAVIENLGRDNNLFNDESLSTLEAILEGKTELTELQNVMPPESDDFIELNNVNFHNQCPSSIEQEVRGGSKVDNDSLVTADLPSSTAVLNSEFKQTTDKPVVPLADNLAPPAFSFNLEEEKTNNTTDTEGSQIEEDDANEEIAISKEDLEISFNKRSCKIVLTRCDNANTDGGITRWKLKSSFVHEEGRPNDQEKGETQQNFLEKCGGYPQTNWSKDTDEEFVASLLRSPQKCSSNPFLSNPMLPTNECDSAINSIEPSQSSEIIEIDQPTSPSPSPPVRKPSRRSKIIRQFQVHQSMEEKKKFLLEQNKLIRAVNGGFQCVPCGKKFENRWNLVVHVRIHTGERPFKCPECDLTFRQLAHAQKHTKKVHRREVYRYEVEVDSNQEPTDFVAKGKKLGRPRKYPPRTAPSQSPRAEKNVRSPSPNSTASVVKRRRSSLNPSFTTATSTGDFEKTVEPLNISSVTPPAKGCIRIMHPDTDSLVEVQGDLLMKFLRPFFDNESETTPSTEVEPEKKEDNSDNELNMNLKKVHSKLKNIFRAEISQSFKTKEVKKRGIPKGYKYKRNKTSILQNNPRLGRTSASSGSSESEGEQGPRKIRSYQCKTCGDRYPCIAYLRIHMRTHLNVDDDTNKTQTNTDDDGQSQPSAIFSSILQNMSKIKRGDTSKNGSFGNIGDNSGEKHENKRRGQFKCVRCNNYYANVYNLHRHKMNSCPFKGTTRNVLNKKVVTQVRKEPVSSIDVVESENPDAQNEMENNKVESTNINTETHKTNVPTGISPKPRKHVDHKCSICGKSYNRKIDLMAHTKVEHGKKSVLGRPRKKPKTNASDDGSTTSVKIEENDKTKTTPTIVKVCERKFKQSSKVRTKKPGQERKRVMCDVCKKTFCRKDVLQKHLLLHSGERPYECTLCGQRFLRPQSLQQHELRHRGEKPHKCDQPGCKVGFYKAVSIKRHREKVHNIFD